MGARVIASPAMRWVPLVLAAALLSMGCQTFDPKHPVVGKPKQLDGGPAIYIWVSDGLWHVRLYSGGDGRGAHRFQGSVAGVRGGVLDLSLTRDDLKEAVALAGDAVQFDVEVKGDDDEGFDVRVASGGCARFDLYVDGRRHADKVRLGPRLQRPPRVPFDRCP
jgi:hypothetical protein